MKLIKFVNDKKPDLLYSFGNQTIVCCIIKRFLYSDTKKGFAFRSNIGYRLLQSLVNGEYMSAIKITTAGGICAVVDLVFSGLLPANGFLRQEDIPLDLYVNNRFGSCYSLDYS